MCMCTLTHVHKYFLHDCISSVSQKVVLLKITGLWKHYFHNYTVYTNFSLLIKFIRNYLGHNFHFMQQFLDPCKKSKVLGFDLVNLQKCFTTVMVIKNLSLTKSVWEASMQSPIQTYIIMQNNVSYLCIYMGIYVHICKIWFSSLVPPLS